MSELVKEFKSNDWVLGVFKDKVILVSWNTRIIVKFKELIGIRHYKKRLGVIYEE